MTTKTVLLGISVLFLFHISATAQNDTVETKREYVAYTLLYNVVPDQFNYPLIGFVNVAKGNHKGLQLGFVNSTIKNFHGLQVGFVNTTLGNSSGAKIGYVNSTIKSFHGLQIGFVNTTLGNSSGAKLGFVNSTFKNMDGLQLGFVNLARKEVKGAQIGFVNIADTVAKGVPIGFLSIVKKGGYRAIETSVNELYPLNIAFKIGVPQLYSFVQGSYHHTYDQPFALGLGMGSLISLGKNYYFNPEIGNLSSVRFNKTNTTTLVAYIRYSLNSRFQLAAGPSAVWLNEPQEDRMYSSPFFAFWDHEINAKNRILIGARISLSYNFTEL